ncbi:hypothetical protein IKF30_02670 [Candidatus Saccharibacteria bacterium]|nr:hypothetical protein [Candidatus Saccharibacteria bacterium]
MQKTEGVAKSTQRKTQSSTTLNRRYVQRPTSASSTTVNVRRSPRIQHFRVETAGNTTTASTSNTTRLAQSTREVQKHPLQTSAINKMQAIRSQQTTAGGQKGQKMTAKEIKNQAIQQALASAITVDQTSNAQKKSKRQIKGMRFGVGRVVLALSCAAIAVLAIVYFVNLNMPDLSLRVAAMQTGINASYPGYIPRGYVVSSITSESKKIILDFKNSSEDHTFTLTEEASSWDSNALLNNYVKESFGEGYKTIKEQGLTIYINGSNAAWVNGGVIYKINAEGDVLTNKQICSIATSL